MCVRKLAQRFYIVFSNNKNSIQIKARTDAYFIGVFLKGKYLKDEVLPGKGELKIYKILYCLTFFSKCYNTKLKL